jgi:hypothetical protein
MTMMRQVTRTVTLATGLLVIAAVSPGAAQETIAEVRTWSGQTLVLAEPRIEVFFTVIPKSKEGEQPPGPGGAAAPALGAGGAQTGNTGAFAAFQKAPETGPEPLPAQRETSVLTFSRGGVELKVPLERIATLTLTRQPVAGSSLPPYVSPTHMRYGATAVLTDGSRVDSDTLDFGTARLRGMTSQGRADVPFEEIEFIKFTR